jgi:hypothetical protein
MGPDNGHCDAPLPVEKKEALGIYEDDCFLQVSSAKNIFST